MIKCQTMTMIERRRPRSIIPPRTMESREKPPRASSVRLGRTSLGMGGFGQGVPRQSRLGREHSFNVVPYVSPKPGRKKPRETFISPESKRIACKVDQMEAYDDQGALGLFLQFTGVELTDGSFERDEADNPDNIVFFKHIIYRNIDALLFLSTHDCNLKTRMAVTREALPFFQEEISVTGLSETYEPKSMTVINNNGFVIVSFAKFKPQ